MNEFDQEITTSNETVYKILEGLSVKRFDNYNDWLVMAMIFVNEGYDLKIFDHFSQRSKKYNKEGNEKIINGLKKNSNGYTLNTLYFWLKNDNKKLFDELSITRVDVWNLLINLNMNSVAKHYYSNFYDKYLRCNVYGWYEYNENNILTLCGETPTSLLNSISNYMQEIIDFQKNHLNTKDKHFVKKSQLLRNCTKQMGNNKFCAGIIDFLKNYYTITDLYKKIDSNKNLIAFDNVLFDRNICDFRKIEPKDYISKTTGYSINLKSNKDIKKEIEALLLSIFNTNEMVEYFKFFTQSSFFGNKEEILYIHTGTGGNGKSLLGDFVKNALGKYFYSADNNFITDSKRDGAPNSSLAQAIGKRYISIQEPKNDYFNTEFIKYITGGSEITTRDLFKSNITYQPLFTPHLQCNETPKLSKIDGGIIRRIKIIKYPNCFVDNPKKANEKPRDYTLKDKLNDNKYVNEFMLMLLETAKKYKEINLNEVFTPVEVLNETKSYLDANNLLFEFISDHLIVTGDVTDRVKASDLLQHYTEVTEDAKINNATAFAKYMKINGFEKVKYNGSMCYIGIKMKI